MNRAISKRQTAVLKGIAIVFVVVLHIGRAYDVGIVNPLGPIAVFLFLFLSGYGLSCSFESNGRKKYFQKKLIKVYLPYCLAIALFIIWMLCRNVKIPAGTVAEYFILFSLPQGHYWYLILMFYWYIAFYLLTFCYHNDKVLIPLMFATSLLIILIQQFSRVYVWQFFSFPMGVLYRKKNGGTRDCTNQGKNMKWGVLLLAIGLGCALLKKLPYVESRELGTADTVLQIGLTLSIGIWLILNRYAFEKLPVIGSALAWFGGVSYELYLSHSIAYDYFKDNPFGISIALYATVSVSALIIIVLFDKKILNKSKEK